MKPKWIVIPAVIVAVFIIYVFYSNKNKDIPINLIGKWTSTAPGYQDRFIELTKETLTYGLGGDKEDIYFISSLKEHSEKNNILYTISYKDKEGLAFIRAFYYHPEKGGTIQFKHQEHIKWRRINDAVFKENSEAGQNETNG
ncbi:MAG: hypothetical protein P8012_02800 [Desulfobacterales bacterium]